MRMAISEAESIGNSGAMASFLLAAVGRPVLGEYVEWCGTAHTVVISVVRSLLHASLNS